MKENIKKMLKNIIQNKIYFALFCIGIFILVNFIINIFNNKELEIVTIGDNDIVQDSTKENNIENEGKNNIIKEDKENEDNTDKDKICVYITGEIKNTGVYYLKKESRIIDVINMAGGATEKADLSKINLAYILEDGMKVNIPNKEELNDNSNFEFITKSHEDTIQNNVNENSQNKDLISSKKETNKININNATQTELETLPGIGPSTALKIIEYRKENGKFNNIEDIKNVSGIGDNKYDAIKELITIK